MKRRLVLSALVSVAALSTACGTSSDGDSKRKPSGDAGNGQCNANVQSNSDEGANHVQTCSPVSYVSNPPSSGNHYDEFPAFGVYESALPRGFWVHSLEHGGVVISYSCTNCDDELESARDFVAALVPDSFCARQNYTVPRVILTHDPELDARWAASSWGHTLRADCFEESSFKAFYDEHVGNAPENICGYQFDPRLSGGALALPADCGQ